MTIRECDRCGSEFDTDRDHKGGDYANTNRCPYCGKEADIERAEGEVALDGGVEAAEFQVTVTIRVDGGDIHVRE